MKNETEKTWLFGQNYSTKDCKADSDSAIFASWLRRTRRDSDYKPIITIVSLLLAFTWGMPILTGVIS